MKHHCLWSCAQIVSIASNDKRRTFFAPKKKEVIIIKKAKWEKFTSESEWKGRGRRRGTAKWKLIFIEWNENRRDSVVELIMLGRRCRWFLDKKNRKYEFLIIAPSRSPWHETRRRKRRKKKLPELEGSREKGHTQFNVTLDGVDWKPHTAGAESKLHHRKFSVCDKIEIEVSFCVDSARDSLFFCAYKNVHWRALLNIDKRFANTQFFHEHMSSEGEAWKAKVN